MSRRHLVMRKPFGRTALVLVSSVAALALAGCGAGQITQTDTQVAAVDGASADAGDIALRDAVLPYPEHASTNGTWPKGSDVPVRVTIVNDGSAPDTLEAVRTSAATKVLVQGRTTIPPGTSVVSVTDESGSAADSTSAAPSSVPSTGSSAAPGAESGSQAGGQELSPLDVGQLRIVLVGTTRELRAGLNTEITFVFRNAGTVTMPVPITTPQNSHRQHEEQGEHS